MRYAFLLPVFAVAVCLAGDGLALRTLPVSVTKELDAYTEAFAKEKGLTVLRKGGVTVIQCASPEEVSSKSLQPLYDRGKLAVARCRLADGTIWLGRKDPTDFYYEVSKYRFWPANWPQDEAKWRAISEEFIRRVQELALK